MAILRLFNTDCYKHGEVATKGYSALSFSLGNLEIITVKISHWDYKHYYFLVNIDWFVFIDFS